jgi:homoserine kinase
LRVAMQDRLHQPYRSRLVPGLEDVIEAALANGAYGACLSGSGPTILALSSESAASRVAPAMHATFEARGVACRSWTLDVDLNGAQVEPPGEVPIASLEPVGF